MSSNVDATLERLSKNVRVVGQRKRDMNAELVSEPAAAASTSETSTEAMTEKDEEVKEQPKPKPKDELTLKHERKVAMLEVLDEVDKHAEYMGEGEWKPGDPMANMQRVFVEDIYKPHEIVRLNEGKNWVDVVGGGSVNDLIRSYYFPYPGKRLVLPEKTERAQLLFSAAGTRLSQTLAEDTMDLEASKDIGLEMRIPLDQLPGLQKAHPLESFHIVPIAADLHEWSTEGLPFWSSVSLGSYAHHAKEAKTMMIMHEQGHQPHYAAGGKLDGIVLPPRAQSSTVRQQSDKDKKPKELFRASSLMLNPWVLRVGLRDLNQLKTKALSDYKYASTAAMGLLKVPAPRMSGKGLNEVAWWILTFHPYFQLAMYQWYAKASAEAKEELGESASVMAADDLPQDYSEETNFSLFVPADAFVELIEYIRVTYHPVNFAFKLTRGLPLVFHNANSDAMNAMQLAEISRTGRDPLLDEVFARVHIEFFRVRDIYTEDEVHPHKGILARAYTDDESYHPVSGHACGCHMKPKADASAKLKPHMGQQHGKMKA